MDLINLHYVISHLDLALLFLPPWPLIFLILLGCLPVERKGPKLFFGAKKDPFPVKRAQMARKVMGIGTDGGLGSGGEGHQETWAIVGTRSAPAPASGRPFSNLSKLETRSSSSREKPKPLAWMPSLSQLH